ncbi:unnamed protein product [Ectocarpus sp. CCAP 1310/34]|nr:unnamed protein product [Ectocarpus sp. CCAP 1310/34]
MGTLKFSEGLWDTWVKLPGEDEFKKVEEIYRKCGYPGASYTSLVVECTCDHSGRIIAATKTYPGAENDKTVIARDKSIWRIRDEEQWKSYFTSSTSLYNADGTETEYTGAWIIVDGGYPKSLETDHVMSTKFA